MKYFAHFIDGSMTKNKAQEAAHKFGKSFGETLIGSDAALDKFVSRLKLGIDLINNQHRRCSDISYTRNHRSSMNSLSFRAGDIFSFAFYPVKEEYNTEEPEAKADIKAPGESPGTIYKF